ncbi:hypothetical protein [Salipiger abyssi]|uniref:hypothetical protein n=1 Tax=Salipiger abyssi TaxID=1250539 RepID=UPI00405A1E87
MIFAVGFVAFFIGLMIYNARHRGRRQCRWRAYRQGEGATRWTCVHCGAQVEGEAGKPPTVCLRDHS